MREVAGDPAAHPREGTRAGEYLHGSVDGRWGVLSYQNPSRQLAEAAGWPQRRCRDHQYARGLLVKAQERVNEHLLPVR